jgi:hypothetical protein
LKKSKIFTISLSKNGKISPGEEKKNQLWYQNKLYPVLIYIYPWLSKITLPSSWYITLVLNFFKSQVTAQKTINSFMKPGGSVMVLK